MGKTISNIMIEASYVKAKEVFENKETRKNGIDYLVNNFEFNLRTAGTLIDNFSSLIKGERYTQTLNLYATEYFLKNILKDYGMKLLNDALRSFALHMSYYEGLKTTPKFMKSHRAIYAKYEKIVMGFGYNNEEEQEEILNQIKERKKDDLINELNSLASSEAETVLINYKSYKRENVIIAKIKLLRGFMCQICGLSIPKSSGKGYVEAAHITPKHKGGDERPNNIMLLCPNHHKEFDLGTLDIKKRNNKFIEFEMNGKTYKVLLSV